MRRLSLIATALLLPACMIDHVLGETAEGGSSGGGGGSSTSGPADPSATSGSLDTSGSGSGSTTGSTTGFETTDTDDDDGTTDTGPAPACDPGSRWVRWDDPVAEPIPGINASFAAVLGGDCSITNASSASPDAGRTHQWEISMDCTLSGRLDGDADVVEQPFTPVLTGTSAEPIEDWGPSAGTMTHFRVVLDHWGMGWNRYVMLEYSIDALHPPELDLVSAAHPDPLLGTSWQEDIEAILGGVPWHKGMVITPIESECNDEVGMCGEVPRALHFGGQHGPAIFEPGQDGLIPGEIAAHFIYASVAEATDISQPRCEDLPLADYRFVAWEDGHLE